MHHTEAEDLRAWLTLSGSLVPRPQLLALLRHVAHPLEIFTGASGQALRQALSPAHRQALEQAWQASADTTRQTLRWLQAAPNRHVLPLGSPDYPPALLQSPDPPLLLFVLGNPGFLARPCVAVVGSRHATPQGLELAHQLGRRWAAWGLSIVSGLAVGIDAAAHEGGLAGGGLADGGLADGGLADCGLADGRLADGLGDGAQAAPTGSGGTVAVVGHGLDSIYPRRNEALALRIQDRGCIVSEYLLGVPARPLHFPARNRIIAGLSQAVVVVEAALRSGSLITARLANECGREVLAVPGPLASSLSAGPHRLIRQGATLLERAEDLLDELPWLHDRLAPVVGGRATTQATRSGRAKPRSRHQSHPPGDARRAVAGLPVQDGLPMQGMLPPRARDWLAHQLRGGPRSFEQLVGDGRFNAAECQAHLLEAELQGLVARLPGGRFQWAPARG